MARGLSDLQFRILRRAHVGGRVYFSDLLQSCFGWEPAKPGGKPGSHRFSRKAVGEDAYHKATASLSRSCLRLAKRGLIDLWRATKSHWSAVEITEAGERELGLLESCKAWQAPVWMARAASEIHKHDPALGDRIASGELTVLQAQRVMRRTKRVNR